jgi:hypothetical protein
MNHMTNWYDRQGQPISMEEVEPLLATPSYKRVASTEVTSASDPAIKYRISTVWLGLDHSHSSRDVEPPIIFETMVFADEPDPERYQGMFNTGPAWMDMLCRRYSNELDAQLGHEETVVLVAATVPDEKITSTPNA